MTTLKDKVLDNLEEVKKYIQEAETKKEEKVVGIAIKNRFTGEIIFQSTKTTYKEAIEEKGGANLYGANLRDANLRDANLRDADLRGADLSDAELNCAKFYGRGGTIKIMKKDLNDFLRALGFRLED